MRPLFFSIFKCLDVCFHTVFFQKDNLPPCKRISTLYSNAQYCSVLVTDIISIISFSVVSFQVYIKVIDTNNHRPQFSTSKYEVVISEDTVPETEILQVTATDRDEKNKLIYTMQSSTDPISLKKFRLDPGTGSLYTSEKLDHEAMHQHILIVMVSSHTSYSTRDCMYPFFLTTVESCCNMLRP